MDWEDPDVSDCGHGTSELYASFSNRSFTATVKTLSDKEAILASYE